MIEFRQQRERVLQAVCSSEINDLIKCEGNIFLGGVPIESSQLI